MRKKLIITGPTTSGKTEVAYECARRFGGEVINGDRFFFYPGKLFGVGTGLADSLSHAGVQRHLYEILRSTDPPLSPKEYAAHVKKIVEDMKVRQCLPIAEVHHVKYLQTLRGLYGDDGVTVVLRPQAIHRSQVERRVSSMFASGLLDEVERALAAGYRDTFPMQESLVYPSLIRYFEGQCSLQEAKDAILEGILRYVPVHLRMLEELPDMHWVEHDVKRMDETMDRVRQVLDL